MSASAAGRIARRARGRDARCARHYARAKSGGRVGAISATVVLIMLGLACSSRRRHLRWHVRGDAVVITPRGSWRCEVLDISLSGVLLATLNERLRRPGSVAIEIHITGLSPFVVRGTLLPPRNGISIAAMFEESTQRLEDAIATLGWLVRDERERPRILVAALEPTCSAISTEIALHGAVALDARSPLEAVVRLGEPVTDAVAALIGEQLSQTSGSELASYVASTHPTTQIEMVDGTACENPWRVRAHVEHALEKTSAARRRRLR